MSHFSVAVLLKDDQDLEEVLEVYREGNPDYSERVFTDHTERVLADWEDKEMEFSEIYKNVEDFAKRWYGFRVVDGNRYGHYTYPNYKWDWYSIGGRWNKKLITKSGLRVDSSKIKDIDWETMRKEHIEFESKLWDHIHEQPLSKSHCNIKSNMTKEKHIERESKEFFITHAVITPDGKWHENGEMGWFGISTGENENWSKEYFDTFIKNADKELTLVIVDCHI